MEEYEIFVKILKLGHFQISSLSVTENSGKQWKCLGLQQNDIKRENWFTNQFFKENFKFSKITKFLI